MKVCLVASNSLDVSPYVKKYMKFLSENNIEFDVVEKRSETDPQKQNDVFTYTYKATRTFFGKLFRFYKYSTYVKSILKNGSYDCVVLFSAINSTFCYMKLPRELKKRYLLDIRDYDKAIGVPFIKNIFKKVVSNACMVIISSEKFKSWLPYNKKIHVMHNLPNGQSVLQHTTSFQNKKIVVGYLGGIGYYNENVAIANSVQNEDNIHLVYRGRYPEHSIKNYCEENNLKNVEFFGSFDDAQKAQLYEGIDIINAVYGNSSLVVTTALPNKLYDCLYYKKPIMASAGTYLGELVSKYYLGFKVDIQTDDISKKIEEFAKVFDAEQFEKRCEDFLTQIKTEQKQTEKMLLKFFERDYE